MTKQKETGLHKYKKLIDNEQINNIIKFDIFEQKQDEKYNNLDNLYPVGISDKEFKNWIIKILIPSFVCVDPVSETQFNQIALYEIIFQYILQNKKLHKKYLKAKEFFEFNQEYNQKINEE